MTEEIWRDIDGYEGRYQVSGQGRVKSLARKVHHWRGERTVGERILRPSWDKDGYLLVNLHVGGKQKSHKVHRLVCTAFVPNPEGKPQVNHISEVKTDNRACNLEWATTKENINFGTRNERMAKTQSKPVAQYTLDGKLVQIWQSTQEAKRQGGFGQSHICDVANRKRKTHKGFVWKYIS